MAFPPGKRLGPYEIVAPLGAGGMGEVYRARDTRLDRTVAIKVLAPHLSFNEQLKQRFEQEARTISRLSHPHICALHDIGHQDGIDFLVIEYLEGETLANRIEKRPMSTEQSLRYGIEIAEALDKAHREGIVHRDLKPGNIMITKSGAMLLDFGLAKLREHPGEKTTISKLSTAEQALTEEGAVLGTVQYMAPEQLEGKEADQRTDIFALGEILYEMTTGKRTFPGTNKAQLISAILTSEPPPISSIQPLAPATLDHVVKKCLAKDPDERWQSAYDVASELKWISEGTSPAGIATALQHQRQFSKRIYQALAAAFFIAAGILTFLHFAKRPAELHAAKVSITLPENLLLDSIALSPDGQYVAFAAIKQGRRSIWVRPLGSVETRELPATEGAYFPFWSPDSQFIAFSSQGKLKKISVSGGAPQTVCNVEITKGGTWNQKGMILLAPTSKGPLSIVSATGGTLKPVTSLDVSKMETVHHFPCFLPDGDHFLYSIISEDKPENGGIYVSSLRSSQKKRLLSDRSNVVYAPPGYLLFYREGNLVAQAFDPDQLELKGEARPIGVKLQHNWDEMAYNYALFSVSNDGTLIAGDRQYYKSQLVWFDRFGKQLAVVGEADIYGEPSISPDEKKVVLQRFDPGAGKWSLWVVDLSQASFSRFTFSSGDIREGIWQSASLWSPDGNRIVFSASPSGSSYDLYQKLSNGRANPELLLFHANSLWADDWSADGRFLLYENVDPKTGVDSWILPLFGDRKPFPFLQTTAMEMMSRFSPNGRWIAYVSDETGRADVFVRPFPSSGGGKWQISHGGGQQPTWRRDGKELFYIADDRKLMAVSVQSGETFEAGTPIPLFQTNLIPNTFGSTFYWERNQYMVAANGQRFLMESAVQEQTAPITAVFNWTALLNH